jgi:hypothetical protein
MTPIECRTPERTSKTTNRTSKRLANSPVVRGAQMSANMAAFLAGQQHRGVSTNPKKSHSRHHLQIERSASPRSATVSPDSVYPTRQKISGCLIPSPHIRSLVGNMHISQPSIGEAMSPMNGTPSSMRSGEQQWDRITAPSSASNVATEVRSAGTDVDDGFVMNSVFDSAVELDTVQNSPTKTTASPEPNLSGESDTVQNSPTKTTASPKPNLSGESDPESDVTSVIADNLCNVTPPPSSESGEDQTSSSRSAGGRLGSVRSSFASQIVEMVATPVKGSPGNIPAGFPGHSGYVGGLRYVAVDPPSADDQYRDMHIEGVHVSSPPLSEPYSFKNHVSRDSMPASRVASEHNYLQIDCQKRVAPSQTSMDTSANGGKISTLSARSSRSQSKLVSAI